MPATAEYTRPVRFTKTNQYGCGPADEDDVYTVAEFMEHVQRRSFVDSDGHGKPVRDGKAARITIYPSNAAEAIPADATHVVWFNK